MDIKKSNIKNMSAEEIFSKLTLSLLGISRSLDYLEIPKERFCELAINEINKTKNTFCDNNSYSEYIKNRIKYVIIENEKRLLNDVNEVYRIVNNYANLRFRDNIDIDTAVVYFKKIEKLVALYNCDLNPEMIIEILKNQKINNVIKTIVDKCLPDLTINKIERLNNSYLLTSFVEVYAMINNIEILEKEEFYDNIDYKLDDLDSYLKEISVNRILSVDEEKELYERYKNGDNEAKRELIECNLKLVVAFAKRYQNRGLALLDLIQEGNIGLMIAIDKYNPNLGCKFSTYAVNWIRQAITRAIMTKGKTVRVPVCWYTGLPSYYEKLHELTIELNREPTIDEMVERYNIPKKTVMRYYELMIEEKSLNEYVNDEKDVELGDFLLHTDDIVEENVFTDGLKEDIEKVFEMGFLTPREIEVLKNRFGFYGEILTLQAIADNLGLTRERIRQIELRALNKIRINGKAVRMLVDYTNNPDKNINVRAKVYNKRRDY